MKVKAVKLFYDKREKKHRTPGKNGEVFEASESRFAEINSTKHGKLVERVPEKANKKVEKQTGFPKHAGGGWYELSNGEKVKGKDAALKAEKEL